MHFDTWTDYALAWLAAALVFGMAIGFVIGRVGSDRDKESS